MSDKATELMRLCADYNTIPTSYKLEGVVKEGDHPHRVAQVIDTWKGRYEGGMVALKVFKVSRQYPHILAFKTVSIARDPPGRIVIVLTDDIAVLQGDRDDETAQARQSSPLSWGVDYRCRLLPGTSLVQERKHHGIRGEESSRQPIRSGQYIRVGPIL